MKKATKPLTIPSYTFDDTSHENVKRVCDRNGNWTHYWLVKEKRFVKAATHILKLGYAKGPRFFEWALSVSKEEAKRKLETAGDEGSRSHDAIRDLIDGLKITMSTKYASDLQAGRQEILNAGEWDNLEAWMGWANLYQLELITREDTIYSLSLGFAGTMDYLGVITVPAGDKRFPEDVRGKKVLLLPDWKTSAAIYDEYEAQLGAYYTAVRELGLFEEFFQAYAGRIFTGVLRLGTRHASGYEFCVYTEAETLENAEIFKAAKRIADKAEKEWEPDIRQIPMQFSIRLPKASIEKPKKQRAPKKKKAAKKLEGESKSE